MVAGIVLKKLTDLNDHAIFLILLGVILKVYYIVHKMVIGEYRPGKEVIYLMIGLTFFLSALYLKNVESAINYVPLLAIGILLKVVFVVQFIIKMRSVRKSKHK